MRFFEKFERVDEIVPLFLSFCKDFHRRRETNCLPESGREQERSAAVSFLQEIPLVQSIPDFSHFIFDNPRKRLYISTQRNQGEFCINESEKTVASDPAVRESACADLLRGLYRQGKKPSVLCQGGNQQECRQLQGSRSIF